MKRQNLLFLVVALAAVVGMVSCNLPSAAPPTPFAFPTPDLTLTAIFSVLVTPTEMPPAVQTATPPLEQPTQVILPSTVTVPPLIQTFIPDTAVPTNTQPAPSAPTATTALVRPGSSVDAVFMSSPPAIDGNLGEWTMSSYTANHVVYGANLWDNTADLSSRFWVGWDTDNLYIATRVIDEDYVQNAHGNEIYLGDSLEILFDADLAGDFSVTSLSADDYQLGISPGFGEPGNNPEAYLWYPSEREGARSGVRTAARRTNDGWDVETAIQWTVFNISVQEGRRYGFIFSISDNDRTGKLEQQTMISNVSTRRLTNPTTWGNLVLTR